MNNYYEFLKIQPNAPVAEIQMALDTFYNQSRRLVTHHDPLVVQAANRDLLMIEQARTTLLDPSKRADYDTLLSLGTMGGLADSSVQPSPVPVMTPPMVQRTGVATPIPQPSMVNNDAWVCSNCRTANPVRTKFCKKCGNQLGRNCPKCSTLLETGAPFCSECGVNVREYERELEIQAAEAERQRIIQERQIAEQNARLGIIMKASHDAMNFTKWGWIIGIAGSCIPYLNFLIGFVSLGFFAVGIVNAQKALRQSQQYGDQPYRSKAKTAMFWSALPIGLTVLMVGLGMILWIVGVFANLSANP